MQALARHWGLLRPGGSCLMRSPEGRKEVDEAPDSRDGGRQRGQEWSDGGGRSVVLSQHQAWPE